MKLKIVKHERKINEMKGWFFEKFNKYISNQTDQAKNKRGCKLPILGMRKKASLQIL